MDKKYRQYKVDDFLQDSSFLMWCLGPDKQENPFWFQFADNYRDNSAEFRMAIQIMSTVKLNSFKMEESEKAELYRSIITDYHALRGRRTTFWRRIMVAAVAVALLCICIPLSLKIQHQQHERPPVASESTEIRLITGKDSHKINAETASIEYNGHKDILVNGCKVTELTSSQTNWLVVPNGKRANITLPDGSHVWINSGSVFSFPSVFDEKERRVTIDGELYIDVTRDPSRPFVVHNKYFETHVLGTSFNVNAYDTDNQPASVVLVNGAVNIITNNGESVELKSRDRFSIKGDNYSIVEVDPTQYISWHEGLLTFSSESLANVMKQIAAFYRIEFICDSDVESLCCSGKLVLFDNIADTFDVLADIFPITCRIEVGVDNKNKVRISSANTSHTYK